VPILRKLEKEHERECSRKASERLGRKGRKEKEDLN
jgi:hypothetical protein